MAERFVVHLPVTSMDLHTAGRMARLVARSLSYLPMVDPGETTVSYEDEQGVRYRVFCDRRISTGRRCLLAAGHDGDCVGRLSRRGVFRPGIG